MNMTPLSLPKITDLINGYRYDWDSEQIRIEAGHLYTHSDGQLSGEIYITTSAPGYAPHLHRSNFNYSSLPTRRQLSNHMKERFNHVDWTSVLEQVCEYTLDRIRRGDPCELLDTSEEVVKPEYLIEPLLVRNQPTVLYGERGSMKSLIALMLMQVLEMPWAENTLGITAPNRPIKCLYLDWETDKNTLLWQLDCFRRGMGLQTLTLRYRKCNRPLFLDVEQIQQHVIDNGADVVIIDSLGYAAGGDLNKTEPALVFFSALRQMDKTSLILAHTSKDWETKRKSVFGSIFFENGARNIWEVVKKQEPGEDRANIGMYHRKPPPFAGIHKPIGFRLDFDNEHDTTTIGELDPRTVSEFLDRMSDRTRILELLKRGPLKPKAIAETLSFATDKTRKAMFDMKRDGKVIQLPDGAYGLPAAKEVAEIEF